MRRPPARTGRPPNPRHLPCEQRGSTSGSPESSEGGGGNEGHAAEIQAFAQTWAGKTAELQLKDLRHRERQTPVTQGTREAVIEAVALQLAQHIGGEIASSSGWSGAISAFIEQIVHHTEMANSCIVAAVIYIERALRATGFVLAAQNWRSVLLAALVLAAKVSDDLSVSKSTSCVTECQRAEMPSAPLRSPTSRGA